MIAPVPFNQEMYNQILDDKKARKVGFFTETPYLPVSKATKRAMQLARKALETEGYQIVDIDFDAKDYAEARKLTIEIICNLFAPELIRDSVKGAEVLINSAKLNFGVIGLGPVLRWIASKLLKHTSKWRDAELLSYLKIYKPYGPEYTQMLKRRYEFVHEFSQKWQRWGIDALVTPIFPHTSFRAKHADEMGLMLEYCFIWSLLMFPAGVVPVTDVQKDEEEFNVNPNDHWTHLLNETAKGSAGLPITV